MDADGFMDTNLRFIQIRSNRLMNSPRNFKNLQQFITYRQRYKLITILNMIINEKSSIQRIRSWEEELLLHRITLPLTIP